MIPRSMATSVHVHTRFSKNAFLPYAFAAACMLLFLCTSALPAAVPTRVPDPLTSEGTEFWLCFQRNFKDSPSGAQKSNTNDVSLELYIFSRADANVSIEIDGISYQVTRKVTAGTMEKIVIDKAAELKDLDKIKRLAVHVISDQPITVYGLSSRFQTTDAFLGLPVSVLGNDYMVMGYKYSEGLLSQFAIIATADGTTVTITPTAQTSTGHKALVPYNVAMKKGDVLQVSSFDSKTEKTDLTGSRITANKPISVFSGHQCAYVPEGIIGCNFLVEQMPPLSSWGTSFIVGKLYSRMNYTVRVLAKDPNTKVFVNSEQVATLGAGEVYENSEFTKNISISANQPVLVAQYSHGYLIGDQTGDPMMLLVTPTEFFTPSCYYATPKSDDWNHYINVVIPTTSIGSLIIDGKKASDQLEFVPVPATTYSVAQIKVPYGSHTITADQPLGLYSYGFGYDGQAYDAYGTSGGRFFATPPPAR